MKSEYYSVTDLHTVVRSGNVMDFLFIKHFLILSLIMVLKIRMLNSNFSAAKL